MTKLKPKSNVMDKEKVIEVNELMIPEGWMIINIKTKEGFLKVAKNYAEILKKDNMYYLLSESNIIFVYTE